MGNLRSVQKAFQAVGFDAFITDEPDPLLSAKAAVLPGVGAFEEAAENLKRTGLRDDVLEFIRSGRPFLGICLGYQLLFERSEESGASAEGLGVFRGEVRRFDHELKIPHMGWNSVSRGEAADASHILERVLDGSYFYFVHSFYPVPDDDSIRALECDYGVRFAAAACRKNVTGVQFHPEKSGSAGLSLLKRFGAAASGELQKEWAP